MEIVLLVARLVLAAVFIVAGCAKAVDQNGTRRAMIDFGFSEKFASVLGTGLPCVEIIIALALIPVNSAWGGGVAAAALLLVFTIALGVNLARGRTPECRCFGQLSSRPVGWSTLARNLGLLTIAGLVVFRENSSTAMSALGWLESLKAAEIVSLGCSAIAVVLIAVALVYLRRVASQQAVMLERIDAMKKVIDEDYAEPPLERDDMTMPAQGLPIGAPAPDFLLESIAGKRVSLDDLLARERLLLLLFVSPHCSPCKELLPAVEDWQRKYTRDLTVAVLTQGDPIENQHWRTSSLDLRLLLQDNSRVSEQYEAEWTPAAVMIRSDGKIASAVTYGVEGIQELVATGVAQKDYGNKKRDLVIKGNGHKPQITLGTSHAGSDLGKLAPSFSLPDLEGNIVNSKDLLVRDTLLLFWDPSCPHCQSMSEEIVKWEEKPPRRAPRLVFVSGGDEENVRAESRKFSSKFLYDSKYETGPLFGTNATPTAVLIDRDGRIASPPTGGVVGILALAGVYKAKSTVETGV